MIDWEPLWVTFKLAFITTVILLVIAIPVAYWLAYSTRRFKTIVEVLVTLPLVLPPSVLGFYLLLTFSPASGLGKFLEHYFDIRLVFSFAGLVIGSVTYSLPFMVHPILTGFSGLSPTLKEASYSLGKTRMQTLFGVLLPNIKPSLLTGIVLAFAHTIGEFGVVLMIGGNIPGQTQVASIAIYDEVESLNYHNANVYALILFVVSFCILLTVYSFNRSYAKNKWI
jgi:molybdate transport system permease protein